MSGARRRNDREVLRDCWGRWTAIVELFARRRPSRHRLDGRSYADLRTDLIAACRSAAEADEPRRPVYADLEGLVRPWLDLRTFARADQEILNTLLLHCREMHRELGGRGWSLKLPLRSAPTLALAVGGAAAAGLVWVLEQTSGLSMIDALRDVVDTVWLSILFADSFWKWSVLVVMLVVAAIYIVSRTARS
jgi:hypothetical protein